jgi:hypothetical protein
MKVLACLVLLFGFSQAKESYFAQNVKWMEEIEKNKDETLKNLASIDFHFTKEMLINATLRFIDYAEKQTYDDEEEPNFCGPQLLAWAQAVQSGQLWAIQVIDALGKLNSGLARGNFRSVGHFRQCVEIERELSPAQGDKYQGKMCIVPMRNGFHELENAFPPADGQAPFPM